MKRTFTEAMDEATEFVLSPGCKTENRGFFFELRVDRSTLPKGWYAYDIMHGDQGGFALLKKHVLVNHAGTFLTQKKVELKNGIRYLCGRGGYSFVY